MSDPDATPAELVVVRHGATAWNHSGRFQGRTDVPLDDVGRAQARAVGAGLMGERFDLAVASDLGRARETAELVLAGRPPALELDARFREMDFGAWEGLTWAGIVEAQPELAADAAGPRELRPPGGETFAQVIARVEPALRGLCERAASEGLRRVLLVTHAGVLHAVLRVALGDDAAALGARFRPASASRFALDRTGLRPLELDRIFPGLGD